MRRLIPAALVAALTMTSSAGAWQRGERTAQRHCERGHVLSCIHRAALHYRQSYSYLRGVAWCESRWNPGATNGQYEGLYQFGAGAWAQSGYGRYSRFSAKWASLAAAHMFSMGQAHQWSCA